MATTNDMTTADGLLKDVYDRGGVVNLIPTSARLTKMIPFVKGVSTGGNGRKYIFPVRVADEQGFTYGSAGSGVMTLNDSVAHVTEDAQIQAPQANLTTRIDFEVFQKAQGGDTSFESSLADTIDAVLSSSLNRTEISMLYGTAGLATISAASAVSSTSTLVTITTGQWANGIWSGKENAAINFYNGSTIIGTAAADQVYTITAIDPNNRQITVSSTAQGATDLIAAAGSAPTIFWRGAYSNEMTGLRSIITNTGSLFGINAATYSLWKGNTYSSSGAPLTLQKLFNAAKLAVARGLDEEATVLVSTETWYDVMNSQAALRVFDSSYNGKEYKNGAKEISIMGPNGADLKLVPCNIVKEGEAFIFPTKKTMRVGGSDWNFMPTDSDNSKFLQRVSGSSAFEIQLFTTQQIFTKTPARCTLITNIDNSN